MDFSPTEEQVMVRDLARQILRTTLTDADRFDVEASDHGYHRGAWAALAGAGLTGLALPEEVGGMDLGVLPLVTLLQEVGRAAAPLPALACLVLGAWPVARFGSGAQRAAHLPGVVAGERLLTAALFEPGARGLRAPATRAAPDGGGPGGDRWRLSGVKIAVPYAASAAAGVSAIVTPAVTDDGRSGLFLVDPADAGLAAQRSTDFTPCAELTLDGTPAEALGSPGDGALEWLLARAALGRCAILLGLAEQALRLTARYAAERRQFGQPIGAFQAVGQRAADAYVDVEAMRVTTLQAAWRLSGDLPVARELAIASWWASEGSHRVQSAAMHLHAGMGFDRDYVLHRYYLAAKALEFWPGGAGGQLEEIARLTQNSG
jgi:alkylation response protein AidB-like acyl-CoA dehydrogenase